MQHGKIGLAALLALGTALVGRLGGTDRVTVVTSRVTSFQSASREATGRSSEVS